MIQLKKIASKSVFISLIFLTSTANGFLPNDHPELSRSRDPEARFSSNRRQLVLPGNRNLARLNQRDRVYDNLYDKRSFRTGTPEERQLSRDLDINRRNMETSRSRNTLDTRADLSRSDSVRQFRTARANFEIIPEGRDVRYISGIPRVRDVSARTDSTRHLRDDRRDSRHVHRRDFDSRDSQRNMDRELRRTVRQDNRKSDERRDVRNNSQRNMDAMRQDTIRVNYGRRFQRDVRTERRNVSGRSSRQTETIETSSVPETKPYVIPQRRVSASDNASRSSERSDQRIEKSFGILSRRVDLDSMPSNQLSDDVNLLVNVAQTGLALYMVWQILVKSSQKSRYRFPNMLFSDKVKVC